MRGNNFGDNLSKYIVEYLSGDTVIWTDYMESDIIAAGSILQNIPQEYKGYIWGSGMMYSRSRKTFTNAHVLAVRGYLSLDAIECTNKESVAVGDPGLLCPLLIDILPKKRYKLGVIPHFVDKNDPIIKTIAQKSSEITVIDILKPVKEVIRRAAECEYIISSSLHGLILADSLGIPADWIELNNCEQKVDGNGHKFRDYFTVYGIMDKKPMELTFNDTIDSIIGKIGDYNRPSIKDLQDGLIQTFPYR